MAEVLQWVVLALVQGLTEFLPISSSAHLILASQFAGWQDQGLVMDIAAHFGSLLAVIWYYRKDVLSLLTGQDWPLFQQILLASIPLAMTGLLFADFIDSHLRAAWVIAAASVIFGVLLWFSQRHSSNKTLDLKAALIIGFAQCLALIPGASRSGVTMTAGMALGLSKTAAAKFSFLLAIPAILMVSAYGALKLLQTPQSYDITGVITITSLSFLAAWLCIHFFMKFIQKIDFIWFMHYRILLALLIMLTLL
ncbi:undecaprenyl-diphosphate phosphatase [Marinicella sp. S1101]|uniref:undecaprenyl-diphosphate phosphatase n=1 Tax=Marinicella marina TaxID=2996016 RepID=UPI002260BE7D|nr:undecaprenyl-diphosphate phosphatase [Marinicella marina]MCX7552725.1 undecaprenyl-diphosphate phosphatase [Marinicella marina]MDJ1139966.1 undecaprenyl-diphosphate phosphatase [Marinicella marina]